MENSFESNSYLVLHFFSSLFSQVSQVSIFWCFLSDYLLIINKPPYTLDKSDL